MWVNPEWTKDYPKTKIVREQYRDKSNPLLIIYPLDPQGANIKDKETMFTSNSEPFIGFAISFPKGESGITEEYAVNSCLIDRYRESEEEFDYTNDNTENDEE